MCTKSLHEKASWDNKNIEVFIKLYVKEVKAGYRPHTHFNREIGIILQLFLDQRVGKNTNEPNLKNKWDCMKKDWGYWKAMLKGETGLGWNHKKQTIDASDDWWEKKIHVHELIFAYELQ